MTDHAAAEAGIRQLQARCADAIWRKDADALGDCFAEDAVWRLSSGGVQRGRAQIVATMRQGFALHRRIFMTFRAPLLTVTGAAASGRTYVTEEGVRADGEAYAFIGVYYERFVLQEDGRWRFAWRQFQPGYAGSHDLSGVFPDMPDLGPPPAMPQA